MVEPLLCEMELGKTRKGTDNSDMDRGDEVADSAASTRGQTSSRSSLTTSPSLTTSNATSAARGSNDEGDKDLLEENKLLKAELAKVTRKWFLLQVSLRT